MNEIYVRTLPLPVHVKAFTVPDAQGDYNVYINAALSAEQQQKSLRHERTHIEKHDFDRDEAVSVIEAELK